VLSLGLDRGWRRRTVRALALGASPRVLDLGTGTGDLALDIARIHPDATVIGLDPSSQMLAIADAKRTRLGLADRVTLVTGDAQQLAFRDGEMDAVTIAFCIRNVPDRPKALREMARVVRPGGRVAILELGEPRRGVLARAARFHTRQVVPRLGALLSGAREYRYLQRSIAAFPPSEEFAAIIERAGLRMIEVVPLTFGVCTLYVATPAEAP
jgi:demethylmenaquinone methyltransferase/2-methoxy-6-polyprenyl-1,4-benzoquinol methylase